MWFQRLYVIIFIVMFLLTIAIAFFSWQHGVGSILPKRENERPRRISIAELTGKINSDKFDGDRGDPRQLGDGGENRGLKVVPNFESSDVNTKYVPKSLQSKPVEDTQNDVQTHLDKGSRFAENKPIASSQQSGNDERDDKLSDLHLQRPLSPSDGGPRIFCMIFTTVANWRRRGQAVRDTWAQRCHIYKFFYTPHDEAKPLPAEDAVPLDVPDGRNHLTAKTMTGLRWAYSHYSDDVDWFFKADDDTFVIMENLRFVAAQFVPSQPHYIGGRSMDLVKHGYNGGGAGYLLSHETARLILEEGPKYPKNCKNDGSIEDLDIGICLEALHVYPIDTRDSKRRLTFHADHPYKIWAGEGDAWRVYTYSLGNKTHGNPQGIRTMSPHTVTFHYVKPAFMYMYDFMLYHLVRHDFREGIGHDSKNSRKNVRR